MARIYKQSAIYDARIASMRNLWEPSKEFQGRPVDKPNYLVTVIVKKTRANWYEEPALANFAASCQAVYNEAISPVPFNQIEWPIKDGDIPDPVRGTAEWRTGQWLLTGSSTSPIEVMINQSGVPVPLRNRDDRVKPGDYVMVATSCAVKVNNPRGVKCYINKVIFMAPGDEIVIGTSVSALDLMAEAKKQGLNVTGFGGGGVPQQGFTGGGFVPPPLSSAPSPGQNGPATVGNAAFPSSGQGFAPSPVAPPPGNGFGFPPRT